MSRQKSNELYRKVVANSTKCIRIVANITQCIKKSLTKRNLFAEADIQDVAVLVEVGPANARQQVVQPYSLHQVYCTKLYIMFIFILLLYGTTLLTHPVEGD